MISEKDEKNYRYYDGYQHLNLEDGMNFDDLINEINRVKSSINWINPEFKIEVDDGFADFIVSGKVKRSDEEIEKILSDIKQQEKWKRAEQKRNRQIREQNELETYKKLHKKYGDKNG